jgi:hypothetical protein
MLMDWSQTLPFMFSPGLKPSSDDKPITTKGSLKSRKNFRMKIDCRLERFATF